MDTEMEIKGFDEDGVKEYATRYLGSKQKCQELLQKTLERQSKELWDPAHSYFPTDDLCSI